MGLISDYFYWEDIRTDVRNYIRNCELCARTKSDNHPVSNPMLTIKTNNVRDLLSLDIVGRLPTTTNQETRVLTCLDVYSRYLVSYALRNATA